MRGHAWVNFRVLTIEMEMFYTEHDFQVDLENLRVQLEISCRENTTLLLVVQPSVYSAWSAIAALHFLFISFSLDLEAWAPARIFPGGANLWGGPQKSVKGGPHFFLDKL